MRDYLFIDNETGWEFFVECESKDEAWQIVYEEFGQNSASLTSLTSPFFPFPFTSVNNTTFIR